MDAANPDTYYCYRRTSNSRHSITHTPSRAFSQPKGGSSCKACSPWGRCCNEYPIVRVDAGGSLPGRIFTYILSHDVLGFD